jgi:hypothetical protein
MSRTRFWTILIGTDSTSFRATDKDTLIPTLRQLQRRHPEAVIRWFERDRLFDSPEQAAAAFAAERAERRPRDWRPGGEHKDPRARYQVSRHEKRRRFKQRLRGGPRGDQQGPGPDAAGGTSGQRGPGPRPKPSAQPGPEDRGKPRGTTPSSARPRAGASGPARDRRPPPAADAEGRSKAGRPGPWPKGSAPPRPDTRGGARPSSSGGRAGSRQDRPSRPPRSTPAPRPGPRRRGGK